VPGALPSPEHLQDANRWPGDGGMVVGSTMGQSDWKAIDHLRDFKSIKNPENFKKTK
jgi:hypothetical protein